MNLNEKVIELKDYISNIEKLSQSISLIHWDMRTVMPEKAADSRGQLLEYLSGEQFKLMTSDKVKGFIIDLRKYKDKMNVVELRMLEELERSYNETKKIPEDRYVAFVGACSKSELAWEKAKSLSDFNIFRPHLKTIVDYLNEFIGYWGFKDNKYDTLLDKYEIGLTVEKLDVIFEELKAGIIEILTDIKKSGKKVNGDFLNGDFDVNKQKKLSIEILQKIGFDFEAGVLAESVHPFTINMGNKDVRLTTNYNVGELTSSIYSSIHEGGHGIYEQHISDDLENTGLQRGASMAIHESQSRFYENIIGRSKEFCRVLLPMIKKYFESLKDITEDEFYESINYVEPSLIRTEADELTYGLHIIIRYEIEKELINGNVTVDELPLLWNKKYKEYLCVEPTNDAEGILQDVHWSDGSFGYFPSYALGNLYSAQIYYKLLEDKPEAMKDILKGNFHTINGWLKEKVHKHGAVYKPQELIKTITGEELNPKYFIKYLKEKYLSIYK